MPPDHYATLGLDRHCSPDQIRSAYRVLAKSVHPDHHGDSEETTARSQELNAAFEVLSDPARRREYDRELAEVERRPQRPAGRIQRDIAHDEHLRVEEFFTGTSLEIEINDPANPVGPETYTLEVPPDTTPGTRFRVSRAEPFEGGHVVVRVKVRPGGRFKVRGSDLQCDLPISAQRAAQGGDESIPGASGSSVQVVVPPGVGRGEILQVEGEGLPDGRGGYGDLLVRVTYRPGVKVSRRTFGRW